ncbi:pro-resilin-like isoform X2 [Penaeus monodon]|uniref:pro-resilin-like isoform X2 n=1 Tax=Penaeus monodon TaxID=6687 RepID=UPI0018A7A5DE|nr:pro-resilin-like isoform X2 [Penaeus monodon]
MNTKVLFLLGLAAIVAADSRESFESFESGEAKYDFNWAVNHDDSGNDFGHQEARDGDHTQGSYYVQLPDGRLQTVKYFVDGDSGYVAEVSYEGEARYPDSYESNESK